MELTFLEDLLNVMDIFKAALFSGILIPYTSQKKTCQKINWHFPECSFSRISICLKSDVPEIGRMNTCQKLHFPQNLFSGIYTCQNLHLAEIIFPRKFIFQKIHLPEFAFG